ncbi:UNVERIFIED_CONTAM: hypothetical protein GTU68_016792 [Idotea baltica]|nr:hypothetical protein [Idotea baltica]
MNPQIWLKVFCNMSLMRLCAAKV